MQYFVNELFVFEPKKSFFYTHEEIIYQISRGINKDAMFYINKEFSKLTSVVKNEESKDEKPKLSPEELEFDFKSQFKIIDEKTSDPYMYSSIDKENFILFSKIVDLKDYLFQKNSSEFVEHILSSNFIPRTKLAVYFHLRSKEYEIENGLLYSFDYMLYKKTDNEEEYGILNKSSHDHSEFGVVIQDDNSKTIMTYRDLHRLHRIAHQFKKKLIIVNIKQKETVQLEKSIQNLVDNYSITCKIFSLTNLKK